MEFGHWWIYAVPVSPSEYDPWPRVWRELVAASGCDGTASRSHTEVPPLSHQAAREVSDFLIQSNLVSSDTCSGIFSYSQTSLVQTRARGFSHTVKSFYLVGTKFHGLTTIDMFVDTWICGFQIIHKNTKLNKYFNRILKSWIVLPTKYTKLNVQQIKTISHGFHWLHFIEPFRVCSPA